MQVGVDLLQVTNNVHLVTIPGKERNQFLVIHAAEDCSLADLEPVDM